MSIFIDAKIDPAANLPTLVDYRTALFDDPRCLGAWSFARENIVQGVGGIASVANLKTNGVPLVQTDSARRPILVYDADLRRSVASFDNATAKVLTATGLTWRSDLAWSLVAIARSTLSTFNADLHLMGGNVTGSDFVGVFTFNNRVDFRTLPGRTAGPPATATGREGWNRVVGVCTAAQEARSQANEGTVASGTSGTANGVPVTTAFQVSHTTFLFGGLISDLLLFQTDLFAAANSDYLATTHAYLDEVNGLYV